LVPNKEDRKEIFFGQYVHKTVKAPWFFAREGGGQARATARFTRNPRSRNQLKKEYGTCPNCGTLGPLDEKLELQPGSCDTLQLKHPCAFCIISNHLRKEGPGFAEHHGVQVSARPS